MTSQNSQKFTLVKSPPFDSIHSFLLRHDVFAIWRWSPIFIDEIKAKLNVLQLKYEQNNVDEQVQDAVEQIDE